MKLPSSRAFAFAREAYQDADNACDAALAAYEAEDHEGRQALARDDLEAAGRTRRSAFRLLMSTPATDGEALAFKIAAASVNLGHGDVFDPSSVAHILGDPDDHEGQAMLALYRDALALAGVAVVGVARLNAAWDDWRDNPCPALRIARAIELKAAEVLAAGFPGNEPAHDAATAELEALEAQLVAAQATSREGAAAQLILANDVSELVAEGVTAEVREAADAKAQALLLSALQMLTPSAWPTMRRYYLGRAARP